MAQVIATKAINPNIKKIHYVSGVTLSVFIAMHLANHLTALVGGPEMHLEWMDVFRKVYRHPVIETVLFLAVVFQITTGIRLLFVKKERAFAQKIQIYSGLYLSFFLIVHVAAVLSGRYVEHLDTNFYYAGVGLNTFPGVFIFIPYYFLSVVAITLHVASLHFLKTGNKKAAIGIASIGIVSAFLIIIGFTNGFQWREMPIEYIQFMEKYLGKG